MDKQFLDPLKQTAIFLNIRFLFHSFTNKARNLKVAGSNQAKAGFTKPWLATGEANRSLVVWEQFARRQSVMFSIFSLHKLRLLFSFSWTASSHNNKLIAKRITLNSLIFWLCLSLPSLFVTLIVTKNLIQYIEATIIHDVGKSFWIKCDLEAIRRHFA